MSDKQCRPWKTPQKTASDMGLPCLPSPYRTYPKYHLDTITIYCVQSTLVISKVKGLSEILRDIRTSTYQICRTEKKKNKSTTTFHIWLCNLTPEVRDIFKILWKRVEIAPWEQFLLFSTMFYHLMLNFHVKTGTRFSLRDKRLFEIRDVEITRVYCMSKNWHKPILLPIVASKICCLSGKRYRPW